MAIHAKHASGFPIALHLTDSRGLKVRAVLFFACKTGMESPLMNIGSVELRFDSGQELAIRKRYRKVVIDARFIAPDTQLFAETGVNHDGHVSGSLIVSKLLDDL